MSGDHLLLRVSDEGVTLRIFVSKIMVIIRLHCGETATWAFGRCPTMEINGRAAAQWFMSRHVGTIYILSVLGAPAMIS